LEKAWKEFPRVGAPLRVLVFNKQGQPVLQYSTAGGASTEIDERMCALGTELARVIYQSVNSFSGREPQRIAFFFEDEVATIQRNDPFIMLVFWPPKEVRMDAEIDEYIARLALTLQEELT
jgi:hypothetical protein